MTEDEKVFVEDLFQKYYAQLIKYAITIVGNIAVAEDLVQDTFYEAMNEQGIQKIGESNNQIGWLILTLKNKIKNYQKRLCNTEYLGEEEKLLEKGKKEEQFTMIEWDMLLKRILTDHELMLFHMYFIEKHSVKEMAKIEGISENAFKVKMNRIRSKVKKEVERENKKKR